MTITEICAKAREEGWRFELNGDMIYASKDGRPDNVILMFRIYDCGNSGISYTQLGEAIAAAMNGEEG